uniref:Uncharacterized protein n=1 Tax=Arundo donax TaxID=35708 RepID=A0A0A8YKJ3_ARUDO
MVYRGALPLMVQLYPLTGTQELVLTFVSSSKARNLR